MHSPSLSRRRPLSPSLLLHETPPPKRARQGSIEAAFGGKLVRPKVVALRKPGPLPALQPGQKYCVDLFCGIGGYSTGAAAAGHVVALAVDCDKELLRCHETNHPGAVHLIMDLGPDTEDELVDQIRKVVPHGAPLHIHGSPPCTKLSTLQGSKRYLYGRTQDTDNDAGMALVVWYFRLILRLRPASWSFEQVPSLELLGALRMMTTLYPSLFAYVRRLNMKHYGVGQARIRCIAGTPSLIAHLRNNEALREEAPTIGQLLTPPSGATMFMSSTGRLPDPKRNVLQPDGSFTNDAIYHDCYRTFDKIGFSCLAGNPMRWSRPDFSRLRGFSPREQAVVQSFPEGYHLPTLIATAYVGVGNAIPPRFSKKLMSAPCVQ